MTAEAGSMLVVVWIPLAVIWVIVLVDLVRRSTMSRASRVAWGVACTLVWPAMLAYLLMRPTSGRLAAPEQRSDPRAQLVDAALDHEAGRIDDAQMAAVLRDLRTQ